MHLYASRPHMVDASPLPRTIADAARALREERTTSVALTRATIDRARALQPSLEAFVTIAEEPALAAAAKADDERARGIDRGPLHGIPLAVKDNIATADMPTTGCTHALDGWWPGRDATVVARLRQGGAIVVGKLALHELAFAPPDASSGFPRPRNPWDVARTPGGSSSGTGVAVAAGIVLGGLGSDTGGSIRLPAAHCGITGLQPSFGRVSLAGVIPGAWSLDVVGPMARSARDCALMLQATAGHDPADPASADAPVPDVVGDEDVDLRGTRIGLTRSGYLALPELEPEVRRAVLDAADVLGRAGAEIVDVEVPYLEAHAAYWTTLLTESFAAYGDDIRRHGERYGTSARRTLLGGILFDGSAHAHAERVRLLARAAYLDVMRSVDAILVPGCLYGAPPLEGWGSVTRMFQRPSVYALSTVVGAPALAVPCGLSREGLPVSVQILARPFDEATALRVGQAYQRATDWHLRAPSVTVAA